MKINLQGLSESILQSRVSILVDFVPKLVPPGFVPLYNGKDLTNWKGLLLSPYDNPLKRAALTAQQLAAE